jgi:O-antigen/teichoic acid export membrane protein
VFFGKALHASLALLIVLALWSIVAAVSLPIAMLLNGAGYLRIQTMVAVVSSLLNLALSIVFTRKFGVIGVCLGSIITQVLITIPICSIAIHRFLGGLIVAKNNKSQTDNLLDSESPI